MKKIIAAFCIAAVLCGCQSTTDKLAESASNKNVDLRGYLSISEIETANAETGTPVGKIIIGKADYKSRKVGIPADQKVPTTGNFRAVKSKSLFGTEEIIIEYDFTAGNDADADTAVKALEKKKEEAEKAFSVNNVSTAEVAADK